MACQQVIDCPREIIEDFTPKAIRKMSQVTLIGMGDQKIALSHKNYQMEGLFSIDDEEAACYAAKDAKRIKRRYFGFIDNFFKAGSQKDSRYFDRKKIGSLRSTYSWYRIYLFLEWKNMQRQRVFNDHQESTFVVFKIGKTHSEESQL